MATEWKALTGDENLKPGDVVRVWYRVVGAGQVMEGWQVERIAKDIEAKDARLFVRSYSMPDIEHKGFFIIEVRETRPKTQQAGVGPYIIGATVGAAVTLAVQAVGIWATYNMEGRRIVEDVGESVMETIGQAAWGVTQWAAVATIIYMAYKGAKG